MSKRITVPTFLTAGLLLVAVIVFAALADEHGHSPRHEDDPADGPIQLSAGLREALLEEMHEVDEGMGILASGIAAGDWKAVRTESEKIHGSYILRRDLSQAQLEELHQALPSRFLELDVSFHDHAARLAHAAEQRDAELAVFYYTKLLNGCVECHASFATATFPGLATTADAEHRH